MPLNCTGGKWQETPLHLAARIADGEKCAEMLIKCGANVRARTEDGRTPLHVAARHGNTKVLTLLLQEDADPMDVAQVPFTSLLFRCCFFPIDSVSGTDFFLFSC